MKLTFKEKLPPKPRCLSIYDSAREIDTAHPLYNEIMLLGQELEELHVVVCIKGAESKDRVVVSLAPNIFVYYIRIDGLISHVEEIWSFVRYHLVWDGVFRPHFILNFSSHVGALLAYVLTRRYHSRLYMVTDGAFLERPRYTREYILHTLLMKRSVGIFTPGDETSRILSEKMKIPHDRIVAVVPPIDVSFIKRSRVYIDYAKTYPMHNFFILSRVSGRHMRELTFVLNVFAQLLVRYTRTALFILVPVREVAAITRIVQKRFAQSVYIIPEDENALSYFGGAHVFMAVTESGGGGTALVQALTTHVPVVTTEAGIAKEIFLGSRYQEFMKPFGDVPGYTQAVSMLIEKQQVRDEYRLNSTLLLKLLVLQTPQGYVAAILTHIKSGI